MWSQEVRSVKSSKLDQLYTGLCLKSYSQKQFYNQILQPNAKLQDVHLSIIYSGEKCGNDFKV